MSRTVTALFDTRSDAEAGRERLLAADIDTGNVRIHDNASMSSTTSSAASYSTTQEPGIWGSIKNAFLPDEDRYTYEEGVRRGGFLLTADVDEDEVDEAVAALENANSVDIDERSQGWRSEGWTAPTAGATPAFFDGGANATTANNAGEEVIPVVEEQLVVGKREVERGGVRVRSYVTEMPVHEQIRLRDEKVSVERRPVDRDLTDVDHDAFRERTIEMTETNEEAIVGKKARIVEEVLVSKTSGERVEDINETVRRTDVDVENIGTSGTSGTSTVRDSAYGEPATGNTGSTLAGLTNEAIGNVKQGIGGLTGNESLTQSGEAQERHGEAQQGTKPGSSY